MVVHSSRMDNRWSTKNFFYSALLVTFVLILVRVLCTNSVRAQSVSQATAMVLSYRGEMLLRWADAQTIMQKRSLDLESGLQHNKLADSFIVEAKRLIEEASNKKPDDVTFIAKKIILNNELNQEDSQDLHKLQTICLDKKNIPLTEAKLIKVIQTIYLADKNDSNNRDKIFSLDPQKVLSENLFDGWFAERVLLKAYKVSGQNKNYQDLLLKIENKTWQYVYKLIGLIVFGILAIIVGLIIIFWQLFFSKPKKAKDIAKNKSAIQWQSVFFVFLAWFSTQIVVGLGSVWLKKNNFPHTIFSHNVLFSALLVALIYLISNGCVLLYIYFFALKPYGINFLDGIKLKFKVGDNKVPSFVMAGLLTWFSAVPLILLTYLLSAKILGSSGSNNPIIAVVMEAAHTNNFSALLLFYFILGVMAPLCEESLFRGFFYDYLRSRYSPLFSNIISAGLFAFAHLDPGGFLSLFCLGTLFAYTYERTGSILPSIIAHGLWNSGTFTLVLLFLS